MSMLDGLARVLDGPGQGPGVTFHGPQEGRVIETTGDGVRFTIPAWSERRVFGPAPWARHTTVDVSGGSGDPQFAAHHHDVLAPQAGQRCVVVFIGPGVDNPWVIAWSS